MGQASLPSVVLRAVEPEDLDMLFTLELELYEGGNSFMSAPPSRHLLWNYIQSYTADINTERQLRLVVCDGNADGIPVGIADISDYEPHDRRGFVGIAILPAMRRRGFGSAALRAVSEYAFGSIGMHCLAAQIAVDNEASVQTFLRAGFSVCGRLVSWLRRGKSYTDAVLMQRISGN